MKRLLFISMLFGAMPLAMLAQDDDLYFVPKKASKASKVETVTDNYGMPKDTYYSGSDRTVDEYNRRITSSYVPIDSDSVNVDVIEDFELTRKMSRFDGYDLTDKAAYWAGYERGRYDWGWHSPWYYRTYGWYGSYYPWYDPWYYPYSWRWYDPWYTWYDPWYSWYGWGYPSYYGYYSWGHPYYYGGGYVSHSSRPYRSPRQSFASERSSFGNAGGRSGGRGSFGASHSANRPSSSRTGNYSGSRNNSGSFGASRPSSSSGSFGGSSRGSGGGGSFGGGGGGSRSGGGGGFGRHR